MTDPDALYLEEWQRERDAAHEAAGGDILIDAYTDPADDFWAARAVHDHILTAARARRAGPWAVLGVTLARIVAQTPPWVVLPGPGSLNLFVGLVGKPGGGKGVATTVAEHAFDIEVERFHTVGVGSGEGLAHLYARRNHKERSVEMHSTAVLLDIAEVDTLAALGTRNASTILPELRKGWSGERLGFSYADPDKRLPVKAHAYRLCLTAGVQPKRAGALLHHSDGGTPQRFLWLPVVDPYAPDIPPEQPGPWTWKVPALPMAEMSEQVVVPVCKTAQAQVDAYALANVRGLRGADGDDLDAHAMFAQLKVAAALALLDGRVGIEEDDWFLASLVKAESDRQRTAVAQALARVAEAQNKAQGYAEGVRATVAAEVVDEQAVRRVGRAITRRLRILATHSDGWTAHADLRRAIAMRDRPHFDRVIDGLVETGMVSVEVLGDGRCYRSAER